jgi:predicted secreted protein
MPTTGVVNTTLMRIYTGGTPTALAHATGGSIKMKHDARDITNKDSGGYEEFLEGLRGAEISGEGLVAFDDTNGAFILHTSLQARTPLAIVFQTGVTGDKKFSATVYLTQLDMDSPGQEQNVTYSYTMKVTGAWAVATIA